MRQIESDALLVRAVEYGESDLVVTFITEQHGKVAAMARGARGSGRKRLGALEPFHTLHLTLDDRGRELMTVKEARIERVRGNLVGNLDAVDAAGTTMRWARHLLPPRTVEPAAWAVMIALLDALDEPGLTRADARWALTSTALRLLEAVGYGLELDRCVNCGRPCPPMRAAHVDAARGGLVCQACGGARRTLSGEERAVATALMASARPDDRARADVAPPEIVAQLLALAEDAMAAHADLD